ncbi:MOSC N-terminal beta barrel domain-containing protein [Algoriphagus sp. CAU 1675]|uniref:MOSC domain-containing protein n=1 Tax=Algoriphagus sp. CAU 1675 TaxID=3032597 RepID=UPI0023DA4505|nr:MOSC N-terminal beta barrel domain-containing protein [Algoriphagus sp. CAU 1675]MDF2157606.1 MOSC domain-containing protein [Algoriphagus sp. CAU 1675]
MNQAFIVQDIFIYPIKSLQGIRFLEARVEEKGFRYDRRWMLVDQEGIFVSQRTDHKLALLQVELGVETLSVFPKSNPENFIHIPLAEAKGEEVSVTVWDDEVKARKVASQIDQWFSHFLGREVSLVQMPESSQRKVSPKYAVNSESVSFADGMPYLIIGQESLNDLNSRLDSPVLMDRFRPNVVFSGGTPFVEDGWGSIKIGDVAFQVVKPCARCVMITVDQETGKSGKEPLKTLASYRTVGNKVMFGQNMLALQEGVVKVGDRITLV